MVQTADIVIIGAGIIGSSTAYHLSQSGIKNIIIIDAESSGGLATRASAAMVLHQTGDAVTTQLSKLSSQKYSNFKDEVGFDINFSTVGSIVFASSPANRVKLKNLADLQNSLGIETSILNSETITDSTRNLIVATDEKRFGTYCAEDGYINATAAAHGYLSRAKERGATIVEHTQVTQIIKKESKVQAVKTNNGNVIYTNTVINCAGAWANDIAQTIGIHIPIKASKKSVGIIQTHGPTTNIPIIEDIDHGWYFRPHHKGMMVGFAHGDWVKDIDREKNPKFNLQCLDELRSYASAKVPNLLPIILLSSWAGYRPMIDPKHNDVLPIIGSVKGVEGYYNNCGYGEFGITHGPIGGELLAQIILGKQSPVDTEQFKLSRFNE